jgi:hypothetical protein
MSQYYAVIAGIDLGDRYTHLCLLDAENGEVIEEGPITTSREAFERRFSGAGPMRVAIEASTHSPWVSRMLEGHGHEVLVANARRVRLIYGEGHKTDRIDALRSWHGWPGSTPSCSRRSSTAARLPRHTWHFCTREMRWWERGRSSSTTFGARSKPSELVYPNARRKAST